MQVLTEVSTPEDMAEIFPGEMNNKKFECVIPLKESSAAIWRKSLKQTYPNVIVGAQRKNSIVDVSMRCKANISIQSYLERGLMVRGV